MIAVQDWYAENFWIGGHFINCRRRWLPGGGDSCIAASNISSAAPKASARSPRPISMGVAVNIAGKRKNGGTKAKFHIFSILSYYSSTLQP
jgi:hypothetical protein